HVVPLFRRYRHPDLVSWAFWTGCFYGPTATKRDEHPKGCRGESVDHRPLVVKRIFCVGDRRAGDWLPAGVLYFVSLAGEFCLSDNHGSDCLCGCRGSRRGYHPAYDQLPGDKVGNRESGESVEIGVGWSRLQSERSDNPLVEIIPLQL